METFKFGVVGGVTEGVALRARGRARALEAWNDFSKKLVTPKPLISPFSIFFSISRNVLGILMCKKKEKKLGSFLAISICL